jgi:hypothetical protein
MGRVCFLAVILLVVFSPCAGSAQAQKGEASFFLRPPAEVARDLFQKLFSLQPREGENMLFAGLS